MWINDIRFMFSQRIGKEITYIYTYYMSGPLCKLVLNVSLKNFFSNSPIITSIQHFSFLSKLFILYLILVFS